MVKLDRQTLKRYKRNKERIKRIDERIDYLCNKDIDVVMGKVSGSSRDFPYTEVRTSVQMLDPVENDRVNREIRAKQAEKILVQMELEEIEQYIAKIEDGEIREIFELSFLQGIKQELISKELGYTQGRISQIISSYLKD